MRLKDFNNMSLDERKHFMKERGIPNDYEIKRKKNDNEEWYDLTYIERYKNQYVMVRGIRSRGIK